MREALRLAKKGIGKTSPNPAVGAVLYKDGRIIARGWHKGKGKPHAEAEAIERAGKESKGAILFVTLEPCCHWGATPPCTRKIIEAGIKKVFVGMIDPNPVVKGKGIKELQDAGIEVEIGILEEEVRKINEPYIKFMEKGTPFVALKIASTLDGKIALSTGESRWITCEESRKYVHRLRKIYDAVLVGVGTILKDNPHLNVRLVRGRNPYRIILDTNLRTPENANVLGDKCIICTKEKKDFKGAEIWEIKEEKEGFLDLNDVLKKCGEKGILSILVEGGQKVFTSFIRKDLFDVIYLFISPKIMGKGISFCDFEINALNECKKLRVEKVKKVGDDLLLILRKKAF